MSTLNRYTATALAAIVLLAAGCGGAVDADKAAQRAAVVSEFERAVDEARFLRDDIAALREDMRAVREAANDEVRRASREASSLRDEITAIRLEMQQLSETAASDAERSAEEARTLRDEIAAIRDELIAAREASEAAGNTAPDVSAALGEAEQYPAPLVYDDEIGNRPSSLQRRVGTPVRVIYGPTYRQRPFTAPPRGLVRDGRRPGRSRDGRRRASDADRPKPAGRTPIVSDTKPATPGSRPAARPPGPAAPASRPAAPAARPAAPASRPAARAPAPAPRPAPVQQKKVHTPKPER